MEKAIELLDVSKRYKKFRMENISLTIPKGIASVLIGNNGAGKTTLLKIMSGILMHEGKIHYNGECVDTDDASFKESMVFIPDSCCFSDFLDIKKVNELMKLGFQEYEEERFLKLCNDFEVLKGEELTSIKIRQMSTGNQMKLMLCAMLARNGSYLLLDEPAANLDPVMQDLLQEKMREYLTNEEHTIVYSTHNIEQVTNVADYAIFMKDGTIIEKGYIDELQEKYCIVRSGMEHKEQLQEHLLYMNTISEMLDGLAYTNDMAHIDLKDISVEKPDLRELSIYLLKKVS